MGQVLRLIKDYANKDQAKFAKAITEDGLAMVKSINSSHTDHFIRRLIFTNGKMSRLTGKSGKYLNAFTGFRGSSDPNTMARRDKSFANHKAQAEKQLCRK